MNVTINHNIVHLLQLRSCLPTTALDDILYWSIYKIEIMKTPLHSSLAQIVFT